MEAQEDQGWNLCLKNRSSDTRGRMFPPQLPSSHFSHDIFSTLSLTPLTSFFWVTAVVNDPEEVAHTERSASDGTF